MNGVVLPREADAAHMSPEQKRLVQESYAAVEPIAATAAALFYDRLFELDPSVRVLFKPDMGNQRKQLMHVIGLAVRGLDNLPALVPVVEQLGRRHSGYGVRPEHYATVAEALLWALERGLGDAFTPEVRAAWVTVYGVLSSTMQRGAETLPMAA